jgi:plasmid stabilization system protein ParE
MAFRVRSTPQAEDDADSILEWLASGQAGEAGIRWYLALEAAIASLRYLSVHATQETAPFADGNTRFWRTTNL